MAVSAFLTHEKGFSSLLGPDDWESDAYYAVLATTDETPDRATQIDYEDILNEVASGGDYSPVALASKSVSIVDTDIVFDCGKITFTSSGSISARYLYVLKGTAASPNNADEILGHIDLNTGGGNLSSIGAEYSYEPHANGLFAVERSIAA